LYSSTPRRNSVDEAAPPPGLAPEPRGPSPPPARAEVRERLSSRLAAHRCGALVISACPGNVACRTDSAFVGAAEVHEPVVAARLRRTLVPLERLNRIPASADPLLEHVAEHRLRAGLSLVGCAPQPFERLRRVTLAIDRELVTQAEAVCLVGRTRMLADLDDARAAAVEVRVQIGARLPDDDETEQQGEQGKRPGTSRAS